MAVEPSSPRGGEHHRFHAWAVVVTAPIVVALTATPSHLLAADEADAPAPSPPGGTILFSSLAPRGWDVYIADVGAPEARRLTDHPALDYNAAFSPDGQRVTFVSERDGNLELYAVHRDGRGLRRLTDDFALDDHPAWSPDGERIAFSSTRQPATTPGRAWNAIYVMNADGADIERVSPEDAADYSPAWSPDGEWIACASGSGVPGGTDLYVMRPDGSERRLVVEDGGWPTFAADGASLFFHRKHAGKWGIWRVGLDGSGLQRVTPEDVEAFTPRASADGKWLVMAVERGDHRQIERFDLDTKELTPVTKEPADHWNPSISPEGQVLFHKTAPRSFVPNVELWGSPLGGRFQMLRVTGAFPAPSPDGRRVALTNGDFAGVDVMNIDGSDRKTIFRSDPRTVFSLSWARRGDRIAFSHGKVFQGADFDVDIETIAPDGSGHQVLTTTAGNDAFPSFSPDGEQLVFRSGRGGSKNLYVMNRDGTGVRRLTEGNWTDTMCDWSPTGEWIVFSSDRDRDFEIWLIRPDGTGLKKLIGEGGRNNHPHFSPDGEWVVFTSQRAGVSAEEISLPHQFQPYGDLFAIRLDGSNLIRLTHNGFEEGTPAWGVARPGSR
jgi:Tol biopolymer transport system component